MRQVARAVAGNPSTSRQPSRLPGPVRPAVPQAVPCPDKPPAGPGRPPLQPGCRPLPPLWCRVIKVHNAPRLARKAFLTQAPHPASALTEQDHLRGPGRGPGGALRATAVACASPCHPGRPPGGAAHPRHALAGPRALAERASTPPVTSRQRICPRAPPPSGRNGTSTPSAPRTNGKAACSAVNGAGVGP